MSRNHAAAGAICRARARRGDRQAAKTAFEESIRILSEIGAKYELARAHLQAGEAGVFSSEYRLTNLLAARTLFDRIGVAYWQERTATAIDTLIRDERTPSVTRQSHPKTGKSVELFIAVSPSMKEVLESVAKARNTDITLLLLGETGVGKDHLARHITGQIINGFLFFGLLPKVADPAKSGSADPAKGRKGKRN